MCNIFRKNGQSVARRTSPVINPTAATAPNTTASTMIIAVVLAAPTAAVCAAATAAAVVEVDVVDVVAEVPAPALEEVDVDELIDGTTFVDIAFRTARDNQRKCRAQLKDRAAKLFHSKKMKANGADLDAKRTDDRVVAILKIELCRILTH